MSLVQQSLSTRGRGPMTKYCLLICITGLTDSIFSIQELNFKLYLGMGSIFCPFFLSEGVVLLKGHYLMFSVIICYASIIFNILMTVLM
jgi:hypothetical protein